MSESKKLKVCLAMGGGVSLGSYSGAALTEALKLLVLYGQDNEGKPYSSVEVDGMSGASAGSIALAIMMRCLIDCKSLMDKKPILEYFGLPVGTSKEVTDAHIRTSIIKEYGLELDDSKLDQLVALEVAQIVQKIIWVDVLNTEKLFKTDSKSEDDFGQPFGLLSRDSAIEAAQGVLFPGLNEINISENKQILSERALMVFTMANLSPISYGEKTTHQVGIPLLVKNFQAATNINNHNEIRVFDFLFSNDPSNNKTDKRYITIPDDKDRSCTDNNTWAEILASAIASGAFPIGFPPAIITKYKEEYSKHEWPNNDKIVNKSTIPDYLNFAYVDGGTFNNEPIKEAFKLGAFIDFHSNVHNLRLEQDRLILFVDPSVPSGNRVMQLKSLDPFTEVKNNTIKQKPDSTKMIDVALDLVGMVFSQGEINEEAKIQAFYKSSMLNQSLFAYFKSLRVFDIKLLLDSTLLGSAFNNLESSLQSRHISVGTREVPEFIFSQYKKLCNSIAMKGTCLSQSSISLMYDKLTEFVKANDTITSQEVEDNLLNIVVDAGCSSDEIKIFGSSVFLAISEMALNQFGKDVNAERAGIFPVNIDLKIEELPGSEIAAFAGFASKKAREACFAKGRLDSIVCLESDHFREYHYNTMLKRSLPVMPYIPKLEKLKQKHDSVYGSLMSILTADKYIRDLNQNMRPKLVDRMSYILNNLINSIKNGLGSSNWFSKIKKIWNLWLVYKNEDSKSEVDNLFTNETMSNMILNKKNIAVKIRVQRSEKSVTFNGNIGMNTVEHEKCSYFKIYLVMVDHLLENECNLTEYCYLSMSNKTNKSIFDGVDNINIIKDQNKIHEVKIGNGLKISSSIILEAFEDNFNKFKYGINPVFDIDNKRNISIDDLSKPLATSIIKEWKPFIKKLNA